MKKKKEELTIPCAYQGGKQRIAKDIVNIIFEQEEITEDTKFYDLCCGSGAITIELINRGVKPENITMVDKSPWGKFWELIGKGEFDLELFKQKIDSIPKDISAIKGYMDILAKEEVLDENIGYDFLLLQAAAFGSKPIHISGGKWKNTNFRNHWMPTETSNRKSPVNPMMPMPDTLYSRVGTIYKKMLGVKGVYDDIENVSIVKEAIIYIDPPYDNTAGYYYEFDYMNFISKYKSEFNIYVSEGKGLEKAVALPINSNRKKGGVNVKRKKAHSEWLNIYKKDEGLINMDGNDIVLTNEEIAFLKEGGQIVPSGFYNKEDVFNEHNALSYLLLEKVLQEKNNIKDSEILELVYMSEENGNILAQWYNEETGIEYRKIQ